MPKTKNKGANLSILPEKVYQIKLQLWSEGFDFSDKTIIQGTNTSFDNRFYALKYGIKKMLGIKSEV